MHGKKPGESNRKNRSTTKSKPSLSRNQFLKSTRQLFLNITGAGAAALSASPSPFICRERTSLL